MVGNAATPQPSFPGLTEAAGCDLCSRHSPQRLCRFLRLVLCDACLEEACHVPYNAGGVAFA